MLVVLLVPASLILISLLLVGVTWFEKWVLSPQAIMLHSARVRGVKPEHVEKLVTVESQRLLTGLAVRPADGFERSTN
ncbi:MAG: hypothetical protein M3O23_00220 [Actinomycetota bacterium]|nr:hypothetical protein [Actinomycetota bacterium]